MKVIINRKEFEAELAATKAAEEFKALLPLTFEMEDMNGNEKCRYLSKKLTEDSKAAGRVEKGDIMLYGRSCIVIFYKSFDTTYSYTRIGRIINPEELEKAAGRWDAEVTFRE